MNNNNSNWLSKQLIGFEGLVNRYFLRYLPVSIRRRLRSAEQYFLDKCEGINTSGEVDCEKLGLDPREGTRYQPGGWWDLNATLEEWTVTEEDVFIDFGSGKGRMVYLAARSYPFKKVIGVDISSDMNSIANANIKKNLLRLRCRNIEFVTSNVSNYVIPNDITVVYMFNPFINEVFENLVDNLNISLVQNPRSIRIIYRYPVMHDCLIQKGYFLSRRLEGLNLYIKNTLSKI